MSATCQPCELFHLSQTMTESNTTHQSHTAAASRLLGRDTSISCYKQNSDPGAFLNQAHTKQQNTPGNIGKFYHSTLLQA